MSLLIHHGGSGVQLSRPVVAADRKIFTTPTTLVCGLRAQLGTEHANDLLPIM
jgi:hypothetical protein